MAKTHSVNPQGWLTLQDASNKIGASPATLRQWADKGKIRTFRTPGGHRRFSESDIRSLLGGDTRPRSPRHLETLVHSALGRARLEIANGRLEREIWYRGFNEASKEQHRVMGRRLMMLLLDALRVRNNDAALVRNARNIGREYGRVSLQHGTSLSNALRAFLFFRDYIFEELNELSFGQDEQTNLDFLDAHRRLNRIVNEMLVSMVKTYSDKRRRG